MYARQRSVSDQIRSDQSLSHVRLFATPSTTIWQWKRYEVLIKTTIWITNKDILYMELCSTSCGSVGERGVWRRMDSHMCMAQSLHCSPETITTLLIYYTPIQNKKCKTKSMTWKVLSCKYNIIYLDLTLCLLS